MIKVLTFIIIMGAVVMFFWHDEVSEWVQKGSQQAEEKAPGLIQDGLNQAMNWWESYGEEWADKLVAELTSQGKEKIDEWLEEKNLNQYGDSTETMYTGGTPLFNEATGQTIERYSYLLQKFPEMIDDLNLEEYLSN